MTRSTQTRLAFAAAALALAIAVLNLRSGTPAAPGGLAPTPDLAPLRLHLVPGTVLSYDVAWSGTQRGRLFLGAPGKSEAKADTHATTTIDMALGMQWYVATAGPDEATIILTVTRVDRHALQLLGADAFSRREDAEAALHGRHALVRLGSDGVARHVAFEPGAPEIFMNLVQWVVAQSTVTLGPSAAGQWDARERGPFGSSIVRYTRSGAQLTRARQRYLSFDAFVTGADLGKLTEPVISGNTKVSLHEGAVERLESEDRAHVEARAGGTELDGQIRFALILRGIDRATAPPPPITWDGPLTAGDPVVGRETAAQLLDQRIGGLTRAQLLGDFRSFANGGLMPEHTRWLWRATGLLKRDPTLAAELARAALADGATQKARALAMDLLSSVGHARAQAAMRDILSAAALATSAERPLLLQRISFLEQPEPATVETVASALREGKRRHWDDLVNASAHTLAATAGAAAAQGDASAASVLIRQIGQEVADAQTPLAQSALLGALANASSSEVATIARPYAASDDPDLRAAAATAVRRVDTPDATGMLLGLLSDANPQVQAEAIASLGQRSLADETWRHIAVLATAGKIPASLDGDMLNLATNDVGHAPAVVEVVAAIAARPEAMAATRARARNMLARAGGV